MLSKRMQTLIKKYGSESKAREAMREWQSRGGKAKVKKGFATKSREEVAEMGRRGGSKSRRTK